MSTVLEDFRTLLASTDKWQELAAIDDPETDDLKIVISGAEADEDNVATLPFCVLHLENETRRKIAEIVYQLEGNVIARFKFAIPDEAETMGEIMAAVKADCAELQDEIVAGAAGSGVIDFDEVGWTDFHMSSDEAALPYVTALLSFSYPSARA